MVIITTICIGANALRGRFWKDSTSSDKKLYYIKDGPFPEKLGWQTSLQCMDERTGEREIISEDPGDSFLVVGTEIYQWYYGKGISRITADGTEEMIYHGAVYCVPELVYADGWLYFSHYEKGCGSYLRCHTKTGQTEIVLQESDLEEGITLPLQYAPVIIEQGWLYTIACRGEKCGVFSYQLETGEACYCLDPGGFLSALQKQFGKTEKESWLNLCVCGDYLILQCWDMTQRGGTLRKLYAARLGFAITEETVWQEVSLPDRPWEENSFPFRDPRLTRDAFGSSNAVGGYVFHDGFLYYLNENWALCSRPLLNEVDEGVVIYEGTEGAVDAVNRPPRGMCRLYFGEKQFYYQCADSVYGTKEGQEATSDLPIVKDMKEYIGELP